MSVYPHNEPGYFDLPRSLSASASVSNFTQASDNPSPTSKPRSSRRSRTERRSKSDHYPLYVSKPISIIDEESHTTQSTPSGCPSAGADDVLNNSANQRRRGIPSRTSSQASTSEHQPLSAKTAVGPGDHSAQSSSDITASKDSRERRPVSWKRTLSGGSFFERSPASKKASSSSHEAVATTPTTEFRVRIEPLRPPPLTRNVSSYSPDRHQVKVETSFTKPEHQRSDNKVSDASTITSRRSSIDPLQLFSSPLVTIRRIGRLKRKSRATVVRATDRGMTSSGHHHRTTWRKDNISARLFRVSSLLAECHLARSSKDPHDHSLSSHALKKIKRKTSNDIGKQNFPFERVQSMELLHGSDSPSSSLLMLGMGTQPPNTPEERATYKVKRSPSADTEEFLKIDISVHGGTSYLPSEATRIHTPPLPKEGPDGRQRGFFFDYDAARHDKKPPDND